MSKPKTENILPVWRLWLVFIVVLSLFSVTAWRVLDLQVMNNDSLKLQGDARTVRNETLVAHRGNIVDRNGEPLAISTPVLSLWANPVEVLAEPRHWPVLAQALESVGIDAEITHNRLVTNAEREFLYVRRRMPPMEAMKVMALNIPGIYTQEEYKRYYPLGEVAAHIVGLTNADDVGQEGMELAYDEWLKGTPGSRQVLKDLQGGLISEVKINQPAQPGNDLVLSIDSRIQYLAYKSLKEAVTRHRAGSGTAVVLDANTGEVLAMVSQPSYNPNNRASLNEGGLRNRAIVDLIEPGSTVKPFTVTAALESGLFDTSSIIDTTPGTVRIDRTLIKDPINYGKVDLEKIITKSSQVGATKLALEMGEEPMLSVLSRVGFGENIGTGFPGEASGILPGFSRWSKSDIAAMAYGYGFHVTPLQLARAYMIFANNGMQKPVSLLKTEEVASEGRAIDSDTVQKMIPMLETVVDEYKGGTGVAANIPSYRVAGKTGTTWFYDVSKGGYDSDNHIALFAGFVPVSNPRIVAVVTIHEPKGDEYGGGQVAAPVFSKIAAGAMRLLNTPPDLPEETSQIISQLDTSPPTAGGSEQ